MPGQNFCVHTRGTDEKILSWFSHCYNCAIMILPVVIIVDSIDRFSLWAIVPANLVVEKTKTEWPVLEPTLSRLGEENNFYGYLQTEILNF